MFPSIYRSITNASVFCIAGKWKYGHREDKFVGFISTESCQLLRRHWSISYSNGKNEVVDGEGVIGEQPTFTPGYHHQYASCTMFDKEDYCEMEGYFLMKYLNRGELLHV